MGKDKQRRAAVAAKKTTAHEQLGQVVGTVSDLGKQTTSWTSATPSLALKEHRSPSMHVGAEVEVTSDYLEMEGAPEDDGLEHCGYLVLHRGEKLRILYIGSSETGDEGWLYGEVVRTFRAEPVGRRGWLPVRIIEPTAASFHARDASTPTAGSAGPRQTFHAPPESPTSPQPQKCRTQVSTRGMSALGASARPPGTNKPRSGAATSDEAFPPLLPDCHSAWGGPSRSDQHPQEESKQEVLGGRPTQGLGTQREAAASAIARQRAVAAKAAAVAATKGSTSSEPRCPICMETYTAAGRRCTTRPCCGTELCVQCDHKSLRSKRCYFCREDGDDFPALSLACRVST